MGCLGVRIGVGDVGGGGDNGEVTLRRKKSKEVRDLVKGVWGFCS